MSLSLKLGLSLSSPALVSEDSFDPATVAYLAAMATQPSDAHKAAINNRIVKLKTEGVWDLLYAIYMLDLANADNALINAKDPISVATNNFCTHTPRTGYKATSSTGYLNTGINPSNIDGALKTNIGLSVLTQENIGVSTSNFIIGCTDGSNQLALLLGNTSATSSFRACFPPQSYNWTDKANFTGLYTGSRGGDDVNNVFLFKNGASLGVGNRFASGALPNEVIYIVGAKGIGRVLNINVQMAAIHKHITLAQHSAMRSAFATYPIV